MDTDLTETENLLSELVRRRAEAEMQAGARAVMYRGPKTLAHIGRRSAAAAKRVLDTIAYYATDPDYADATTSPHLAMLAREIERELLSRYSKGVFSLATRWDCPLMWSHYGDQHRGLCIGYSVPEGTTLQLHKVNYSGNRSVQTSSIAALLDGNDDAVAAVDKATLLTKASSWKYEREWRLLGSRGLVDSPLELVEIVFGLRCADAVAHAVNKALDGRERGVALFEVRETRGTFRIQRQRVDESDFSGSLPRRALSALDGFESLEPERAQPSSNSETP